MSLEQVLAMEGNVSDVCNPQHPSTVIKEAFIKAEIAKQKLTPLDVEEFAQKTVLSTEEVEIWLKHMALVKKRRQEAARKTAATRKLKSSAETSSRQVVRDRIES